MKATIVLSLATISDAQIIIESKGYVSAITNVENTNFVQPAVSKVTADSIAEKVEKVTNANNALSDALNAGTSPDKIDKIKAARTTLDRYITILANSIEDVANDPLVADEKRTGIVHSAGFSVKTFTPRGKAVFEVTNNAVPGSVHLVATGKANAHLWTYTTDLVNFGNRIHTKATTVAITDINGLTSGTKYAFFHQAVTPDHDDSWEGPEFQTVT